jgi:hypothetical protein
MNVCAQNPQIITYGSKDLTRQDKIFAETRIFIRGSAKRKPKRRKTPREKRVPPFGMVFRPAERNGLPFGGLAFLSSAKQQAVGFVRSGP